MEWISSPAAWVIFWKRPHLERAFDEVREQLGSCLPGWELMVLVARIREECWSTVAVCLSRWGKQMAK